MACGRCGGYYLCVCDEKIMEEEIENLRNKADSIELKLLKLREQRRNTLKENK